MEKKNYVVNVMTYIYVEAESEEEAQEKVLDIMNTAYEQGDESAYFPNIETEAIEEEWDDGSSYFYGSEEEAQEANDDRTFYLS